MYSIEQAKKIVYDYINKPPKYNYPDDPNYECQISNIEEKDYGWIFSYQSKPYLETGDIQYACVGTSPIIFEKETGRLVLLASNRHPDYFIDLYEKGEWNVYAE